MADVTTWTDPKTRVEVRVGDIWRDSDPRMSRRVVVTLVNARYIAYRTIGLPESRKPAQTKSHMFVKRFVLVQRPGITAPAPAADPNASKPCAHCGGADLGMTDSDCPGGVVVVECRECGARGPIPNGGAPDGSGMANEAWCLWNERAEVTHG